MLTKVAVTFTSVVLLAAANAKALGLGEVTLDSALNQPLVARIELLQLGGVAPDQIQVQMASAEDFNRLAIDRIDLLDNIRLSIDSSGTTPYIQLSTVEALAASSLSFVLETRWPAGRLLSEHSVRLDGPGLSGGTAVQQPIAGSSVRRLAAAEPTDSIAVGPDDTLWDIALAVRPDSSVTVQQTMLALQRLNPGAFIADNINMVRNGEVLRIPDLNEIRSVAVAEAINEVSRQNQLFDNRQNVPLVAQPLTAQPDPATNAALNRGELRVVSSDDSAPDTAAVDDTAGVRTAEFDARIGSLENQLAVQAEEVDRVALQNEELSARLSMLEEQIASAQEIIRLRDLELAQLQQALAAAAVAEAAAGQTSGDQPGAVDASTDPAPVIIMAGERSLPQRLLDSIVANSYMLLGVGVLVILLLVFALLRRGRSVEEEEEVLPGSADASDIKVDGLTAMEEVTQEPAAADVFDDLGFLDIEVSDEDLAAELEQEEEQSFRSAIDEAASKLDLARAYIEMGDQEGAREILDEVVVEGSPAQAEDARTLLGKL